MSSYPPLHHTPSSLFFFFNDTATTEIYTLSLHDALPILPYRCGGCQSVSGPPGVSHLGEERSVGPSKVERDRKSTRLNSSHLVISYAVFCLKKKKKANHETHPPRAHRAPFLATV